MCCQVMTTEVVTASSSSSRQEAEAVLKSSKKSLLPIVNEQGGELRLAAKNGRLGLLSQANNYDLAFYDLTLELCGSGRAFDLEGVCMAVRNTGPLVLIRPESFLQTWWGSSVERM